MRQNRREKLLGGAKHLGVFLCLYVVTAGLDALASPGYLYLFGWTTHSTYLGLWLFSPVLALLGKDIWAWFVTWGNVLAVMAGQFLGDWIEGMLPEDPYGTRLHTGFLIWLGLVLVSILAGGFVQWRRERSK